MIYLFVVILSVYVLTICWLIHGFAKIQPPKNQNLEPKTHFSIIVPFRNEASNFLDLLNSISNLEYPKKLFEIVVVNDDSDDDSVLIFNQWKSDNTAINTSLLQNIRLTQSPKKDAILTAISQINTNWIITTDADCVVNKNWLLWFDNCIQNSDLEMIAGLVSIEKRAGFLNNFQFIDLLSLQGTTIGSFGIGQPFMCNGANFAYTKTFFQLLKGFDGNNEITSGDDLFLLQKAVKLNPEKVKYLKTNDAIVLTKPETSWAKLFQQRVRWASKTGAYDGFFGKYLAVLVLLMNLSMIIGFLILPILIFTTIFLTKIIVDYILLFKTNQLVNPKTYIFPVLSSLFYPIFCVLVAFYSLFGSFEWKKRRFNQ